MKSEEVYYDGVSFYFTTYLTENEHYIVADMIETECKKRGFEFVYYRKFKEGHVPMYRECKINAHKSDVVKMLEDLKIEFGNANQKVWAEGHKVPVWAL